MLGLKSLRKKTSKQALAPDGHGPRNDETSLPGLSSSGSTARPSTAGAQRARQIMRRISRQSLVFKSKGSPSATSPAEFEACGDSCYAQCATTVAQHSFPSFSASPNLVPTIAVGGLIDSDFSQEAFESSDSAETSGSSFVVPVTFTARHALLDAPDDGASLSESYLGQSAGHASFPGILSRRGSDRTESDHEATTPRDHVGALPAHFDQAVGGALKVDTGPSKDEGALAVRCTADADADSAAHWVGLGLIFPRDDTAIPSPSSRAATDHQPPFDIADLSMGVPYGLRHESPESSYLLRQACTGEASPSSFLEVDSPISSPAPIDSDSPVGRDASIGGTTTSSLSLSRMQQDFPSPPERARDAQRAFRECLQRTARRCGNFRLLVPASSTIAARRSATAATPAPALPQRPDASISLPSSAPQSRSKATKGLGDERDQRTAEALQAATAGVGTTDQIRCSHPAEMTCLVPGGCGLAPAFRLQPAPLHKQKSSASIKAVLRRCKSAPLMKDLDGQTASHSPTWPPATASCFSPQLRSPASIDAGRDCGQQSSAQVQGSLGRSAKAIAAGPPRPPPTCPLPATPGEVSRSIDNLSLSWDDILMHAAPGPFADQCSDSQSPRAVSEGSPQSSSSGRSACSFRLPIEAVPSPLASPSINFSRPLMQA